MYINKHVHSNESMLHFVYTSAFTQRYFLILKANQKQSNIATFTTVLIMMLT